MRWEGGRRSDNIEDRRGMPLRRGGMVGGGIGTIVLVLLVSWFLGMDPTTLLQNLPVESAPAPGGPATGQPEAGQPAADDPQAAFVATVLGYTEDTWSAIFRSAGEQYQAPRLVMFSGATQSACGLGEAAMGPFYCPGDRKVYIDLDFFRELRDRFQAPGDFAQAYVIAHELGHHVQNLTGVNAAVREASEKTPSRANEYSVRQELQADCFAGAWAYSVYQAGLLESGDIEEALNAASAVGDDRIQKQSGTAINQETWTHGSSAQRVSWFKRGFESGDPGQCDTFSGDY